MWGNVHTICWPDAELLTPRQMKCDGADNVNRSHICPLRWGPLRKLQCSRSGTPVDECIRLGGTNRQGLSVDWSPAGRPLPARDCRSSSHNPKTGQNRAGRRTSRSTQFGGSLDKDVQLDCVFASSPLFACVSVCSVCDKLPLGPLSLLPDSAADAFAWVAQIRLGSSIMDWSTALGWCKLTASHRMYNAYNRSLGRPSQALANGDLISFVFVSLSFPLQLRQYLDLLLQQQQKKQQLDIQIRIAWKGR